MAAAISAAVAKSDALLVDERYAQAAEAVSSVIGAASAALGSASPRVLRLRQRRAAILVIGGDYRRALPEFDALAKAYQRGAGPGSEDALECARQAAYCRAELGETTAALRQFEEVLSHVRAARGDADPMALDLRRSIGLLLLSEGKTGEAVSVLKPLYDDLCVVFGQDHEDAQEVADILARLSLSETLRP